MAEVAKRVSLTQPAPLQIDSTEPDVIKAALERTPGRAIVNSVNLEAAATSSTPSCRSPAPTARR